MQVFLKRWFAAAVAFVVGSAIILVASAIAAAANEADMTAIEIGHPARIEVLPASVKLAGPRSKAQLVVTGHYADGSVQDLTRASQFASTKGDVASVQSAVVRPHADGKSEVAVVVAGRAAIVPVEVSGMALPQPVSFEFEALAALSKQGCNSGACHGSPSGKGGFRLSLRAFDPVLDKLTLIREDLGRRTDYLAVDDMAEIWWDAKAKGPDEVGIEGTGMWRFANGGKRYLPGEMPETPTDAFRKEGSVTFFPDYPAGEKPPEYPSPRGG